jgi:hypothetical protein
MTKNPNTSETSAQLQFLTSLPHYNLKHIDYVIVHEELCDRENLAGEDLKRKQIRKEFFANLKEQTFELFDLEIDISKNKKCIYTLLHCPLERLLQEAERSRLEMRLKNVNLNIQQILRFFAATVTVFLLFIPRHFHDRS